MRQRVGRSSGAKAAKPVTAGSANSHRADAFRDIGPHSSSSASPFVQPTPSAQLQSLSSAPIAAPRADSAQGKAGNRATKVWGGGTLPPGFVFENGQLKSTEAGIRSKECDAVGSAGVSCRGASCSRQACVEAAVSAANCSSTSYTKDPASRGSCSDLHDSPDATTGVHCATENDAAISPAPTCCSFVDQQEALSHHSLRWREEQERPDASSRRDGQSRQSPAFGGDNAIDSQGQTDTNETEGVEMGAGAAVSASVAYCSTADSIERMFEKIQHHSLPYFSRDDDLQHQSAPVDQTKEHDYLAPVTTAVTSDHRSETMCFSALTQAQPAASVFHRDSFDSRVNSQFQTLGAGGSPRDVHH